MRARPLSGQVQAPLSPRPQCPGRCSMLVYRVVVATNHPDQSRPPPSTPPNPIWLTSPKTTVFASWLSPSCRFSPLPVRRATQGNPDPEVQESYSCSQLCSDVPRADWPISSPSWATPRGRTTTGRAASWQSNPRCRLYSGHADAVRTARAVEFIRLPDGGKKACRLRWTWNLHCPAGDFWRPLSISRFLDRRNNRVGILMTVEPAQTLRMRRGQ
jgi:hypothetical protein